MKILLIIILSILFFWGCEENNPYKRELVGMPTAFVLSSKYISHNSTELVIEMDIAAITSRDRNYININDSAFKGRYVPLYKYTFNSIERLGELPATEFSTILAFDQSGSYENFDPVNQRLRAMYKIVNDFELNPKNEIGLAYYSRSDLFKNNIFVMKDSSGNPFRLGKKEILENQFWMTFNEKGTSNMYDALSVLIDKTDSFASNSKKSVTMFIHNHDDFKGADYEDVVDKAIKKGIQINIISIEPIVREYNEICMRTGGFLHLIDSRSIGEAMDKGTPALAMLHKTLSGQLKIYRLRFTLKRNLGTYNSGMAVSDYLIVQEHDANGEELIYNLLGYYIIIP